MLGANIVKSKPWVTAVDVARQLVSATNKLKMLESSKVVSSTHQLKREALDGKQRLLPLDIPNSSGTHGTSVLMTS